MTRSDLRQEKSFFGGSVSSFLQLVVARSSFSFPSDHFYRIHGSAVGKWNKIFIRFFRSTKDTRGMDPHGWLWAVQV